jgi:hypothetical protein
MDPSVAIIASGDGFQNDPGKLVNIHNQSAGLPPTPYAEDGFGAEASEPYEE